MPEHEIRLVEGDGMNCGWSYIDRWGEMYPCDKPSIARLVDGPELWEGWFCQLHAKRALNRARRELIEATGY